MSRIRRGPLLLPSSNGDAERVNVERAGDAEMVCADMLGGPAIADVEITVVGMEADALTTVGLDNRVDSASESSHGIVADDSPDCRSPDPLPLPVGIAFLVSLSSDPWSALSSFGPWPAWIWEEDGSEKHVGRHVRCG